MYTRTEDGRVVLVSSVKQTYIVRSKLGRLRLTTEPYSGNTYRPPTRLRKSIMNKHTDFNIVEHQPVVEIEDIEEVIEELPPASPAFSETSNQSLCQQQTEEPPIASPQPRRKRKQNLQTRQELSTSEEEEVEPYVPQAPKKKRPAPTPNTKTSKKSAWSILRAYLMIPLLSYGRLFTKYKKTEALGKMDKVVMNVLHSLLMVMGKEANTPGQHTGTYLSLCLGVDLEDTLSTTFLNAAQEKKLLNWVKEFIVQEEELPLPPPTAIGDSPLLSSTLPSPPALTTSTQCTTARGTTARADAGVLENYSDNRLPNVPSGSSLVYLPKTSSFLRSISWKDQSYRYSARSRALSGTHYMKLEIYEASEVDKELSQDWWKHAAFRSFIPINNKTRIMEVALNLQQLVKDHVEKQPDAEGECCLHYSKKR